jgi:nicotinate-nucleotide adenylyltransferase
MKIGLFFGSFNPIHTGHLVIADYMAEFTDLKQVWFVISPRNPLKAKQSLLQDFHRLALVREGIKDNKKLKASNIEFKLSQPSYTINTLIHLSEQYPQHEFVLIMGCDNLQTFDKWKNYNQIFENYEIYVYPRANSSGGKFADHPKVKMIDAPIMEISASFIRKAIKDKKDVRYMMPESVYNYIEEMHFYEK